MNTEMSFMESTPTYTKTRAQEDRTHECDDILSADFWKNSVSFREIMEKETQIRYYKKMGASQPVMDLVDLESKAFGTACEKIIAELFSMGKRTSSENDGTRNGKKIEIKSARYWGGKDDCKWQHLEENHDYEYVIFVLLDFGGFKVWGSTKSYLMGQMRDEKVVTFQGKQGWWTNKSAILPYLTPIRTVDDLDSLLD